MSALLTVALHIVLWHAYRAGEEAALVEAARQYNASQHDVEVQVVPVPFDAYAQKIETAIPHGNGPDLFIAAHERLGDWKRDGVVAPYKDDIDRDAFVSGTLDAMTLNGQHYGYPLGWKSVALFYRTDLLKSAPQTTDELFAAAPHGVFPLAYEVGSFYYHAAWLAAFGGEILSTKDGQLRPVLDTPADELSIDWVIDHARRGHLPIDASGATATQLFRDGRAAAILSGPWLLGELTSATPFAVAPLPRVSETGQPARPLESVEGVFLSPRAHDALAAEKFAAWLAGPGALIRAHVGRQLVASQAAWSDPALANDPILGAFRAQLATAIPMSSDPVMSATWEPAQEALRKATRGELSAHDALLAADRRITIALAPPPAAKSALPYLIVMICVLVGVGAVLLRRPSVASSDSPWGYLAPAVVCLVVLVFVPFAIGAGMSLFHHVPGPNGGTFIFVGLDNFIALLGSRDQPLSDPLSFYFTLVVTILWTLVNVFFHVVIGVTLALFLRDPYLRLRGIYRVLLIVPWAMPSYITALVWKGMFHRQLGAINAVLGLLGIQPVAWFAHFWTSFIANVTTNVWLGFPFMMVVTLGALARIPKELEEAASLDGANGWQRLRYVILPLLRPAIMPSVVLGAVWTFNMFNVVFLVSGGEPDSKTEILISQAYRWAFGPGRGQRYGYAAAYAVVIFLLLWTQSRLSRRLTEVDA